MIDDNGGEYSNESNDNMTARASGETVTESQNKKVSVSDNHSVTVNEYSYAAEPPVQFRLSHLSRRSEPL